MQFLDEKKGSLRSPHPVDLEIPAEKVGAFDAERQCIRDAGLSAPFILAYTLSRTRPGQPMTAAPVKRTRSNS